MHTSHAGKRVQRTGWHIPPQPHACAQPGTAHRPALPSAFTPWGREMYQSRHSSMESLGCPCTSGDKHIPPKSCILLMGMDHLPPASICRTEKLAAFLERRMCCLVCFAQPSCCMSNVGCLEPDFFEEAYQVLGTTLTREALQRQPMPLLQKLRVIQPASPPPPCLSTCSNPVSLHTHRQRGKCTDEHEIWLPVRPLRGSCSAWKHEPQATSFKNTTATSANHRGWEEERGRRVCQLQCGCTNVQLLVGLLWFPLHPQQHGGPWVFPAEMILYTSECQPAVGVMWESQPGRKLGSMRRRGSRGDSRMSLGMTNWPGTVKRWHVDCSTGRGHAFNAACCQGKGDAKLFFLPAHPHGCRNYIHGKWMPSSRKCHLENITGFPGQTSQNSAKPGAKQHLKLMSNGALRGNSLQGYS